MSNCIDNFRDLKKENEAEIVDASSAFLLFPHLSFLIVLANLGPAQASFLGLSLAWVENG